MNEDNTCYEQYDRYKQAVDLHIFSRECQCELYSRSRLPCFL